MDFVKQAFAALFVLISGSTCISQVPTGSELFEQETGLSTDELAIGAEGSAPGEANAPGV